MQIIGKKGNIKMIDYRLIKELSRFYSLDTETVYNKIKLGYFKYKINEIRKGK